MREVDHAHDAENEIQPARHQRVDATSIPPTRSSVGGMEANSGALQIEEELCAKAVSPPEIPGVRLTLSLSLSTRLSLVQTTTEDFT